MAVIVNDMAALNVDADAVKTVAPKLVAMQKFLQKLLKLFLLLAQKEQFLVLAQKEQFLMVAQMVFATHITATSMEALSMLQSWRT